MTGDDPANVDLEALERLLRQAADAVAACRRAGGLRSTNIPQKCHDPDSVGAAAVYIRDNPGRLARQIAPAIGMSPGHFRSYVVPRLKARGFYNQPGSGYFPPVV